MPPRVVGEAREPPIQGREAPDHTAAAKVLVEGPRPVAQFLPAGVSLALRFAVPPQLVMASRPEDALASEVLERVPGTPRVAARMVLSAERAPRYWVYEYLEIRLARAQTAI